MARLITRKEAARLLDVSPQTVSNWVESGILICRDMGSNRKTMLIDRESIDRLLVSMEELAGMEWNIIERKEELRKEAAVMDEMIRDAVSARVQFEADVPQGVLRQVLEAMLNVALEKSVINDRRREIVDMIASGRGMAGVAENFGLTTERIRQLFCNTMTRLGEMANWDGEYRLYKMTQEENRRLESVLREQEKRIEELERQLGIEKHRGADGTSFLEGYTNGQLVEVLGRRLAGEGISVRALNGLRWLNIETVGQLVVCNREDLLKIRNFGKKSLSDLDDYLDGLGLSFGMDAEMLRTAEAECVIEDMENGNGKE